MSLMEFIASDCELSSHKNEKIKTLSINEAIKKGLIDLDEEIDDWGITNREILKDEDFDAPDSFLCVDDEEALHELSIFPQSEISYESEYTDKKYCATIEWQYSEDRAHKLIEYIKEQLSKTDEVEVWSVWLDEHSKVVISYCNIDELTPSILHDVVGLDSYEIPKCLIVKK